MAFNRPTLSELVDRIQTDFVSRLELIGALLRKAVVYVMARVMAGASHMMHGHLEFLGLQLFPDKSEAEFLLRQASLFGISQNAPTFAKCTASVTGTNGTPITHGALLVSSGGFEYSVDADVTISGGVGTIAVTAVEAGSESTVSPGVVLDFESPIGGVSATATVVTSTADGADQEAIDGTRSRLLDRMGDPPMGGNDTDYKEWAESVTGVTRVWVVPRGLGPGTVLVYFARDLDPSPIPDFGEVAAVQAVFDADAPSHATAVAAAPTLNPIAMTLSIVPDNANTRAAIAASLDDLYFRVGDPRSTTVLISAIRTAIGEAEGVTDYTLTVPAGNITQTVGQLPSRGTITYV